MDIDENAPGNISQKGVTSVTDNESGFDPRKGEGKSRVQSEPSEPGADAVPGDDSEIPLAPDDEAAVDEDMADVDANNSVSSDHPAAR